MKSATEFFDKYFQQQSCSQSFPYLTLHRLQRDT